MRTTLVALLFLAGFGPAIGLATLYALEEMSLRRALETTGILTPVIAAATTAVAFYFRAR